MKQLKLKLLFIAMIVLAMFADSYGQAKPNAKVNESGNYIQVKQPVDTTGTNTGKTYTTSTGVIYPVKVSSTGKLFIVRVSRDGRVYKQYLKI